MNIENSVVFVSGANRGFGLALVRELLARGAKKVYAGMRSPEPIDLPGIVPVKLDVTDPISVAAAAEQCGDTTLLINNAGLARMLPDMVNRQQIEIAREMLEVNFFGTILLSQAFAPILGKNGGGALINVLSVATWIARPMLGAYAATKSAAWAFTNALRVDLREQGTQVMALHVGFMDTDMTKDVGAAKSSPVEIAKIALDGVEAGGSEILADDITRAVKKSLSSDSPIYLNPPNFA